MRYAHFSERFERDAKTFGFTASERESLRRDLRDGLVRRQDSYAAEIYAKQFRGQRLRIIIWEYELDPQTQVLVALKIFGIDEAEFKDVFANRPREVAMSGINLEALKLAVAAEVENQRFKSRTIEIIDLSVSEREFLETPLQFARQSTDDVVFETYEWVSTVRKTEFMQRSEAIYCLVLRAHEAESRPELQEVSDGTLVVSFFRFDGGTQRILLLVAVDFRSDGPLQIPNQVHSAIAGQLRGPDTSEALKSISRRCYPGLLLFGQAEWMTIEGSGADDANLALSFEELGVLASMTPESASEGNGFPVFVNGRPGTGKSTVLHYAFAEYVSRYLDAVARSSSDGPEPLRPIFLTHSNELLTRAKSNVEELLQVGASKLVEGTAIALTPETREHFNECFRSFRSFLIEQLPREEQLRFGELPDGRSAVDATSFVDFSRFKRLVGGVLNQTMVKRHVSPELAWHVIRTYIKGWHFGGAEQMSPDAYAKVPRGQQTVEVRTFELVFNVVWKSYLEQCEKQELWDDQDLVGAVLRLNPPRGAYAAVFCDEAQDFTNIELDLISKLSLFTRRRLDSSWQIAKVPIAFAGDPFQTLNPTGFKWESVRARYFTKIREALAHTHANVTVSNERELSYNYRSTAGIVAFCNLLQLVRGLVFDIGDLEPQAAWRGAGVVQPYALNIANPVVQSLLRNEAQTVVLVDCFGNEVLEYVAKDDFLGKFAIDSDGRLCRTIASPAQVKGLEFDAVILYKFGESALQASLPLAKRVEEVLALGTQEIPPLEERERLPFEYFFNRLYVAASRAKKSLLIVDTAEAFERFWAAIVSREGGIDRPSQTYSSRYGKMNVWAGHIAGFTLRDDLALDATLAGLGATNNPAQMASQFEAQAAANADPETFRLAALNYRLVHQSAKAIECDARASALSGDWKTAGELFKELGPGYYEKAQQCFWRGADHEGVVGVADAPERKAGFMFLVSVFMTKPPATQKGSAASTIIELVDALGRLGDLASVAATRDATLASAIERMVEAIEPESCKSKAAQVMDALDFLKTNGYAGGKPGSLRQRAHIAYFAGRISECVKLLSEIRDPNVTSLPWAREAHLRNCQTLDDRLSIHLQAGDFESAWEEVSRDGESTMSQKVLETMFARALLVSDHGAIVNLLTRALPSSLLSILHVDEAVDAVAREPALSDTDHLHRLRELALNYMLSAGNVQEAYDFCASGTRRQWSVAVKSTIERLPESRTHWYLMFITLVNAPEFPVNDETTSNQRKDVARSLAAFVARATAVQEMIGAGMTWAALGSCFERLGNIQHARRFYQDVLRSPDRWRIARADVMEIRKRDLRQLLRERDELSGDLARQKEGEIRETARRYELHEIAKAIERLRDLPACSEPAASAAAHLKGSGEVAAAPPQVRGVTAGRPKRSFEVDGVVFELQVKSGRTGQVYVDVASKHATGEVRVIPMSGKVQWQEDEAIGIPATNGIHRVDEWGFGIVFQLSPNGPVARFQLLSDGSTLLTYPVPARQES